MARKNVNTVEDKIRYEIINEGYSLYPLLKIRINALRDTGLSYTDAVSKLVKEHTEPMGKKIISAINDKCCNYLIMVLKEQNLL